MKDHLEFEKTPDKICAPAKPNWTNSSWFLNAWNSLNVRINVWLYIRTKILYRIWGYCFLREIQTLNCKNITAQSHDTSKWRLPQSAERLVHCRYSFLFFLYVSFYFISAMLQFADWTLVALKHSLTEEKCMRKLHRMAKWSYWIISLNITWIHCLPSEYETNFF